MFLDFRNLRRSGWRKFAVLLGIWTLLLLSSAAENYASQIVSGRAVPVGLAFRRAVEEWGLWAVISVGVLALCDRFPLVQGRFRRHLLIHAGAGVFTALVYLTVLAWVLHGQRSVDGTVFEFPKVFQKLLIHYLVLGVILYWMVVLGHTGWLNYQQAVRRERQAAALSTELVQARLDALRMQLNPHFLFNTLHTISALIHDDPQAADRMVVRLSDLLRQTLSRTEVQEVPLRQELAFLEGYLDIERTRFQDRLAVTIETPRELSGCLVPFLILQPLVENAIRHGIEPRESGGCLVVRARCAGEMLELTVQDNGPGLPDNPPGLRKEGVGLSNVRSRLLHLYGDHHRFELKPAPGGGLLVVLQFPCRQEVPHTPSGPSTPPNPSVPLPRPTTATVQA